MAKKNLNTLQAGAADRLLARALPEARQASRRSVLRHALGLFNADGVEATTIDDLKRASGQSVGTIYHHFKNKEGVVAALFFALFDDQSRAIAERIAGHVPRSVMGRHYDRSSRTESMRQALEAWANAVDSARKRYVEGQLK